MQMDPEMVKRFPNHRGWTIRTETGVFGASFMDAEHPANAWYCQHFWQHFEFGQEPPVLRRHGLPDDETGLRVLDRPSSYHARRTDCNSRRLVGRVGPRSRP